jgi:uncharacterized protein
MKNTLSSELELDRMNEFFRSQPVLRAYIFGSYARNENNPDSDIDILVEMEKGTDLFRFIKIKIQLEKLLNKTVDLVSSNGLSRRLKPIIDAERILVYEK